LRNTFKYAFFEVYAEVMGPRSQRAFANRKLDSHFPVMLHLGMSLVKVIVENEFLFVSGQQFQTL